MSAYKVQDYNQQTYIWCPVMPVPAESRSLALCEYGYWGVNLMTFYLFYPAFYPAKVLDIFDDNLHY